ncbi:MAG: carboxypeptidase-like regulatory domain-containing protein [Paludibacteraceae bacterium]
MSRANRYSKRGSAINIIIVLFSLQLLPSNILADGYWLSQNLDSVYVSYSGVVADKKNGEKLPFAHISILSSGISTVTNSRGEFLLKIPVSMKEQSIEITLIGYQTLRIPIGELDEKKNKIYLTQTGITLPEVSVILSGNALETVKKMLNKRDENYDQTDRLMTAFYREIIKKRNTPVSISESVVEIYKESYSSYRQDGVSLVKSRKSTDYEKLDTLVFKLMGGPYNTLFIDVMKYPEYFMGNDNLTDYEFKYAGYDKIDELPILIIEFKQNRNIKEPLFYGKLYIDIQNFGLARAEFDVDLGSPQKAAMLFIRKKPFNAKVSATKAHYIIDYHFAYGKWRFAYSRIDLGLKLDWNKKFFNTYYNTSVEMAATNWNMHPDKKIFKEKNAIYPSIVLQDAVLGFEDSNFWGENNIIEPEKPIENAIKKIEKQLIKEK